jgi:hypothetical protein
MSQVNTELGLSSTATISLNDAAVRTLAGVASGAIGMSNLQGKTNEFAFTISTNQIDANLRTLAINAGWNGTIPVRATINSGVWISGSVQANSTPALTINGSFPNGVTLINSGTIAGRGGNGGAGGGASPVAGTAGGLALLASVGVTIQNNGTIAGGGGGGGGAIRFLRSDASCGGMGESSCSSNIPGSGGGGGRSNVSYNSSGGAAGGTISGCSGTNPTAGTAGTSSAAGSGGTAGFASICTCTECTGSGYTGGSGGDWGIAGGGGGSVAAGGAAGNAISGNSNITWSATGTRLGPIT